MNSKHYYPEKVRELRKPLGSRSKVAKRLNVTETTLYRAEKGLSASFELLFAIAELAGSDVRSVIKPTS